MNPQAGPDFEATSRRALAFLQKRFGFNLWMVTRTRGEDWIVLNAADRSYGIEPGKTFRWSDSFCYEMVQGHGPRMAPDSDLVPAYADAPIGKQVDIKAYVGVPLTGPDGSLFGTLCAIDPKPQPESITAGQRLIELTASLLSAVLSAELALVDERRRTERLAVQAFADPLTGLSNRRAWEHLLSKEEDRCRRYGQSAAVVVVDLDGLKRVNDTAGHAAGDAKIIAAAEALNQAADAVDVVARLGGDEFGVVIVDGDAADVSAFVQRMYDAFAARGVEASVGVALRRPSDNLEIAWERADERMINQKRSGAKGLR